MKLPKQPLRFWLAQIVTLLAFAWIFVPEARLSPAGPLKALINWDAFHYLKHAENGGYRMPNKPIDQVTSEDIHSYQANVLYLPAWPETVRLTTVLTGLPAPFALLGWTLILGATFWLISFRLLEELAPGRNLRPYLLGILLYPSSFFIALPYTEALSLLGLLGWIWGVLRIWRNAPQYSIKTIVLTAFAGFTLGSSRLVNLPLLAYPCLLWLKKRFSIPLILALGLIGVSGFVGFLVYCHYEFGVWNLYERTQQIGWGIKRDAWAVFKPMTYIPRFFFEDTVRSLSRSVVPAFALFLVILLRREVRHFGRSGWLRPIRLWTRGQIERVGLYVGAILVFYIIVTSRANHDMDCVLRYMIPAHVLLVLAWASLDHELDTTERKLKPFERVCVYALAFIQLWCVQRYLRGKWVA